MEAANCIINKYDIAAEPIKSLELHYTMILFLIIKTFLVE